MANTGFMIVADQAGVATAVTTTFIPIAGTLLYNATETSLQTIIRDAGTFHDMFARVTANTQTTGTSPLTFRKNAANGNQTFNIGTSTGTFHDTTHTDAVVAADKVDYNIAPQSASKAITLTLVSICFDSTTNFSTRQVTTAAGLGYTTGAGFNVVSGNLAGASSETGILTTMQKAGTFAHGMTLTSANAKTSTMTMQSRLGTPTIANGNIAVAVTTAAGITEDTTHTDTIAVANTWNWSFVVGTDTSNAATFTEIGVDFETTVGNIFMVEAGADADVAGTVSTTVFCPIGGKCAYNTTESNVQSNALAAFTYSNMSCRQTQNSTATGTGTFRKNAGTGNQTFSFGTGTGTYTDSTHTDAVVATDNVNYSIACGATTAGSFSKWYIFGSFTSGISQTVYIEWEEE